MEAWDWVEGMGFGCGEVAMTLVLTRVEWDMGSGDMGRCGEGSLDGKMDGCGWRGAGGGRGESALFARQMGMNRKKATKVRRDSVEVYEGGKRSMTIYLPLCGSLEGNDEGVSRTGSSDSCELLEEKVWRNCRRV